MSDMLFTLKKVDTVRRLAYCSHWWLNNCSYCKVADKMCMLKKCSHCTAADKAQMHTFKTAVLYCGGEQQNKFSVLCERTSLLHRGQASSSIEYWEVELNLTVISKSAMHHCFPVWPLPCVQVYKIIQTRKHF